LLLGCLVVVVGLLLVALSGAWILIFLIFFFNFKKIKKTNFYLVLFFRMVVVYECFL